MPSPSPFLFLFVSSCFVAESLGQRLQAPYAVPNYVAIEGSAWPSASTWVALNGTLGGRLQALRPWAAVCYTEDPLYDPVKCKTVLSNYTNDHTVGLVSLPGSIS